MIPPPAQKGLRFNKRHDRPGENGSALSCSARSHNTSPTILNGCFEIGEKHPAILIGRYETGEQHPAISAYHEVRAS